MGPCTPSLSSVFKAALWNLSRDHLMVMSSGDLQLAKTYPVIVSRRFNTREGVMAEKKKKPGKKKTVKKKPAVKGKSFKGVSVAKLCDLLLGHVEQLPSIAMQLLGHFKRF